MNCLWHIEFLCLYIWTQDQNNCHIMHLCVLVRRFRNNTFEIDMTYFYILYSLVFKNTSVILENILKNILLYDLYNNFYKARF